MRGASGTFECVRSEIPCRAGGARPAAPAALEMTRGDLC